MLFLSESEKKQVWVVLYAHHLQIITNLRNYVKGMPRKNIIYVQWIVHMNLSVDTTIDSRLMDGNGKNFRFNSQVLPSIVEAVLLCAKQRIAFQAHQQDKIDFVAPA